MKLSVSLHRELLNTIIEFRMIEFAKYGHLPSINLFGPAAQYSIS
jgi:hypothetical protein